MREILDEKEKYKDIFSRMLENEQLFHLYLSSLLSSSSNCEEVKTKRRQLTALNSFFLGDVDNDIPGKELYKNILNRIETILTREEEMLKDDVEAFL